MVPTNFPRDPRFCQIIQAVKKGREKCQGSYQRAGYYAAKFGVPYVFRCHAGLIGWASPLIARGKHVGTVICSQVLMWEPDDFFWVELAEMTHGLNVDIGSLVEAARELPIISSDRVQAGSELLFAVCDYVVQSGLTLIEQRKRITRQQARLGEEIRHRKRLENLVKAERRASALFRISNNEYELLLKIKVGDTAGAHKMLDQILADIIAENGADLPMVKTRLQELAVLMVRAAAEAGGDVPRLLALSHQFLKSLSSLNTIEEVSLVIAGALDMVPEERLAEPPGSRKWVIQRAINFMRQNYHRKLTLAQIAKAAFVSKYHLCHVFKKELGCTVLDYPARLRVEEAKKMLRENRRPLREVVRLVGFSDPSYFCKAFRKTEGITPGRFQKRCAN
jgi:two-component system response regulator YesN